MIRTYLFVTGLFLCAIFHVAGASPSRQSPPLTGRNKSARRGPLPDSTHRPVSYVDPLIGSGGHGHVFVGASVPFGAVQVGPNNIFKGWDWCSGYHYSDSILIGFSQLHLSGTGGADLGDVLIMPYTGGIKTDKGSQQNPGSGYSSRYSHQNEKARPGYYSVRLDDYDIDVELTAAERVAFHRYHFPAEKEAHILIDLKEGTGDQSTDTYLEQTDSCTLEGYRFSTGWSKDQRVYFAIRLDKPMRHFQLYNDSSGLAGNSAGGKAIIGLISFDGSPAMIQLKVGLSPVSAKNALNNILAEIPGWDFRAVAMQADEKWNKELSKIRIETENEANKKIFYTALFHTMIDPTLFNDHNRDYRGTDKKIYRGAAFQNYTVFSLWDTYRALQPLYTIIQPERVDDMIRSMLAIFRQQGKLPVWHLEGCETNAMPGISSMQVVAEAFMKGFKGFDPDSAFDALKRTSMRDDFGLIYDRAARYIPCDTIKESVARALEYGVSNASIAIMAKKLGRKKDYEYYYRRFHNYELYFDREAGFFRGKKLDGSWNPVFDPLKSSHPWINDLSEGNSWQYLWLVPEDVSGLMRLLGGKRKFVARLDSLFSLPAPVDADAPPDIAGLIGQYAHGNEPGHHIIYLYAYAGRQWQTAEKARQVLNTLYHADPDGLSGNEDCGQMSAWYIFSALGFYPVFPAGGTYVLGSPLFDKVAINLPGGKTFTIQCENNRQDNPYIQTLEWNGRPYTKSYLLHQDIMQGGVLKVRMGPKPNYFFGSKPADRPRTAAGLR